MQLTKLLFDLLFTLSGWVISFITLSSFESLGSFWKGFFVAIAAIFCGIYGYIHIYEYYSQNRTTFNTQDKANEYLADWIGKNTGHVLVYTNDISWAGAGELRDKLTAKAKGSNLTLCLRRCSEEAKSLQKEGAELFLLDGEADLYARFIIVDYKSDNPKISIYTTDHNRCYVNQQYDNLHNPVVRRVFLDLAKLATKNISPEKAPFPTK